MTDKPKPRRIVLSTKEMADLMRHSGEKHTGALHCDFGTGGVALALKPDGSVDSAWALPLLAEWRGIAFTDGAGI